MALAFLLDENLRGLLWLAISRHNATSESSLDATRVGDVEDLPLGSPDPEILVWAEENERILISLDISTMPDHLALHLASGRHSPGVFMLRHGAALHQILEFLVEVSERSEPYEWRDRIELIP